MTATEPTPPPDPSDPPATAAPAPTAEERTPSRGRRLLAAALIALATLLLVLAIAAVWVKRQALDTAYWRETSSELLEDAAIRTTVADYLVDQLYTNVDVAGELRRALPERLAPLAGPAAGGLRDVATRAANRALEDPRVQSAWVEASAFTHGQFVRLIEGEGGLVTLDGDAVILNLAPLVNEIAGRVGIGGDLGDKLPAGIARVEVIRAQELSTLQTAVRLLQDLVIVLALLVPLLFALAVFLVPGRRRQALLGVGAGIAAAGLLVVLVHGLVGNVLVDQLSSTAAIEPTVSSVWRISTQVLHDIAINTFLFGLVVMLAASLAGRSRPATALRRAAAPTLRDRPELSWGGLAVAVVAVLALVDIPATRQPYGVLLIILLACGGFFALRRQVVREFPDAVAGSTLATLRGALPSMPRRGGGAGAATAPDDRYAKLAQLADLRDRGVLTEDEFAVEKSAVLAGAG